MSRSALESFGLVRPILRTSANTIVDLADPKIYRSERRDCTAAMSQQDRHVRSGGATFL